MTKLLRFQRKIVSELSISDSGHHGDGLVILAKGLGLSTLLTTFVGLHADPRNLILLLNTPAEEIEILKADLTAAGKDEHLNFINNETPASARYAASELMTDRKYTSRRVFLQLLQGF